MQVEASVALPVPAGAAWAFAIRWEEQPEWIRDAVWVRVARAVCADRGVRLLGVHVLTPHGQREVNLDDAL